MPRRRRPEATHENKLLGDFSENKPQSSGQQSQLAPDTAGPEDGHVHPNEVVSGRRRDKPVKEDKHEHEA